MGQAVTQVKAMERDKIVTGKHLRHLDLDARIITAGH
jgi:hypothetical protein